MFKNSFVFILLVMLCSAATAQDSTKKKAPNIKPYWLVIIKTGPKQDFDSAAKAKIFAGHFSNMTRLHEEGVLKVAGPFGENNMQWRGLFIFDCPTLEDAQKFASTDPAVASGIFTVDIVPWYTEPSGSFKPAENMKDKPKTQ